MRKQVLVFFALLYFTRLALAQTPYEVTDFAGSGKSGSANGTGVAADFSSPYQVCADASGNLYVADAGNHKIRKITPAGVVTDFAGSGKPGSTNGPGAQACFNNPTGLCVDGSGNLLVVDRYNNKIRKVAPDGTVSDFAGSGRVGSANGSGAEASFNSPMDIVMDASGDFFVTDRYNNKIRKITPDGEVSDFVGSGSNSFADGTGAAASFNWPFRLCIGIDGNLYVADYSNHSIRKVTPAGVVTTLAGTNSSGFADGNGTAARFNQPSGICMDASGNIYVSENGGNRIRKITLAGDVSGIAGTGNRGSVNGIGSTASFSIPLGIGIVGNVLYIADALNNKIRKMTVAAPAPPAVNYVDLPASVCLGSTLNKEPVITGSSFSLKVEHHTVATNPVRSICRGNNGDFFVLYVGDSIVQYTISGARIKRYDDNATLSNIRAITVDGYNRVYAFSDGINSNAVHRIAANGWVEFGGFLTPDNYFTGVSDLKLGKDGALYVADTINGGIYQVDTATSMISVYADPFQNAAGVNKMSFGKNELYIFKKSEQKFYVRDLSSTGSFTQVFQGIDTLGLQIDYFEFDTTGLSSVFVSSRTTNKLVRFMDNGYGFVFSMEGANVLDYTDLKPIAQPLCFARVINTTNSTEKLWVATGNDELIDIAIYAFTISPPLPEGLSFDVLRGRIVGSPKSTAPATTYTVSVYSDNYSTQSYTFNFSVDATGTITNTVGNTTASNKQSDGLKINYFDINNCEELMAIEDEKGGTVIGEVVVKQQVLPTLASFASGTFVRRVTDVNAQNADADARIKLYFTNDDINHYNATNGPSDPDLDNNTTRGTMPVAILQLHKSENGTTEQIKHNPLTANWDAVKQLWIIDFPITKFSTFYMGESSSIGGFDCSNTGPTTTASICGGYYIWRDKVYNETGIYKDTTANQYGCDSILTLDLTVTYDFGITQDEFFPEYLYCNISGADSYQWIYCDNGGLVIDGATSETFEATSNGSYAVVVTNNSCTDTSLCITVTGLQPLVSSVTKGNVLETVSVYPNPGTGIYHIESVGQYRITVRSSLGEVIFEDEVTGNSTDLDLSAYPSGIYQLTIQTESAGKTVKLIKN